MGFLDMIQSLFEKNEAMSNIPPEDSGIDGVILWASTGYVAGKKINHGPCLKVYLGTSVKGAKSVSVTITKPPRVLGKMPKAVQKDVEKFIEINFDLLLAHWENQVSSKTFLLNVKKIDS